MQGEIVVRRETNAELLVPIVNLAYRSPPNFGKSWTGEGHLVTGPRVTVEELKAELETPGVYVFAAFDADGVICGSVQLRVLQDKKDEKSTKKSCSLGMLNVDPHKQAQGIGRKMVQHAETFARDQLGVDELVLHVLGKREELIAWYGRLGFVEEEGHTEPFPNQYRATDAALADYGGQLFFRIMRKQLKKE